ncbi:MAG: LysR family transcriptional regulator, partial [Pygmaiobacter sp.]
MELRNLVTFLKVAELKSFSRAAETLGYTQSTVTVHVRQLEDELEVRLFERFGRRVSLTPQGELLVPFANRMVGTGEEAKKALRHNDEAEGTLRLGILNSIGASFFPDLFSAFHAQFPAVQIVVQMESLEKLYELLHRNEVDMLFIADSERNYDEWIQVFAFETQMLLVAPKNHPLVGVSNPSAERLAQEKFLLTEKNIGYRHDIDRFFARHGCKANAILEAGDTELIARLVARGEGLSYLPAYCVEQELACGALAVLPQT